MHNEDRFLKRAVENVLEFCDRILVAEHRSTDGTLEIAEELARQHAKVELHRIREARASQEMLRPFAGTDTWVLGVDGDEIYDPAGLLKTRRQLESGAWDGQWVIFGNVLNCVALDESAGTARGYLAPPCRSMTKLYNFAAVERLDPHSPQRLMGRHDRFRPGYHAGLRLDLYKEVSWEAASFRCLHACFVPRSSAQVESGGRPNLTDLSRRPLWRRLLGAARPPLHKEEKYCRGPEVTVDASAFFPRP